MNRGDSQGNLDGRVFGDRFGILETIDVEALFLDLRERVVEFVEAGASRHEAAECFVVSVSSAIRWMQRRMRFGSVAAKPSGGSTSPLEAHAPWLLKLIAEHPDLTLDEIVLAMHQHGLAGSRSAVWRFFDRHKISFKKSRCARRNKAGGCGTRAPALDARPGPI